MSTLPEIRFYHLQTRDVVSAVPEIAAKAVERGQRVSLLCADAVMADGLDAALWSFDPASFLPHGRDPALPIYLTVDDARLGDAPVLMVCNRLPPHHLGAAGLVCFVFDDTDPDLTDGLRGAFRTFKDAGHAVTYYRQDDDGKWQKMGK